MAEIRQLTRRVDMLEETVKASPASPAMLESLVKADTVSVLEKRVADLETSLQTYKKFLEEALAKLGLLEQKVNVVETKVCQCSSDCGGDSVVVVGQDAEPTVQMVLNENPMYLETDDEAEAAVDAADA